MVKAINCYGQAPFTRDIWLNETGTPVKVNALARDGHSGFYLATGQGGLYFNGRSATHKGGISSPVSALAVSGLNIIYGCTDGAVYEIQPQGRRMLVKAKAPIRALLHTNAGLIIGTDGDGLYRIATNGATQHFTTQNGLPDDYIYSLLLHYHTLLIGTDLDLYQCTWAPASGLQATQVCPFGDITRVVKASPAGGRQWIGFQEKGIAVISAAQGATAKVFALTNKTVWNWGQVNDLLPASDTEAYVATEEGRLLKAKVLAGNALPEITELLNLGRRINAIAKDPAGNLWLATDLGLTQATAAYFQALQLPKDYALQKLTAAEADGDSALWYTQINELWHLNLKTKKQRLDFRSPVPLNCLHQDEQGTLWIGTSGNGLWYRNAGGERIKYSGAPGLANGYLLDVSGSASRIWLSTLNGVEELDVSAGGSPVWVQHHGKKNGLGSDYVYRIFTDSKQRTWFATDGAGIAMYTNHRWQHWDRRHGFTTGVVYAVAEDSRGNIWAATLHDGLLCYNGRQWKQFTRKSGLQDATVTSLSTDAGGHVFAVSARGIDEWYPEDQAFRHINRRSGFGIDSVAAALNTAIRTPAGVTYIPYEAGLLQFSSGAVASTIRPGLKLSDVLLYFKQADTPARSFRYDQNHLTFNFTGTNFAHAEQLHYRYRLAGFNKDWINTTDESVTYPQLQAGQYIFQLQASLNEQFNHPAVAAYAFTITPPFWKTWWFRLLAALLAGSILYAIVKWRTRAARRLAQAEHERMAFEYEHLKSQVNPHFLFNSLNTLATLIEEDSQAAVTYTEQLSDLYRDALTDHREDMILLEEEWAVLERYYYIQRTRFGDALQIVDRIPEATKKQKKIVPLALQLLVENAVKHNVVSRSSPLIIFIEVHDDWLVIRNSILLKSTREKSTGIGLKNIRKRYALITRRKIELETHRNEFIVKLPLL